MPAKVKPWYEYARSAVNVMRANTPLAILKCKDLLVVKMIDDSCEVKLNNQIVRVRDDFLELHCQENGIKKVFQF